MTHTVQSGHWEELLWYLVLDRIRLALAYELDDTRVEPQPQLQLIRRCCFEAW